MAWLRRIGIFAAAVIALEVIAAVGIFLLGPDAMQKLLAFYAPAGDPTVLVKNPLPDGAEEKCSTYQGEVFCIRDAPVATVADTVTTPPSAAGLKERRCATYEGHTICLEEGR